MEPNKNKESKEINGSNESSDATISGVVQGLIAQYRSRKKRKDLSLRKKTQFKNRIITANKRVILRKHIEHSKTEGEGNNSRKAKKMTKPELKCLDILIELNFIATREEKILGKYYDFKINGHKNIEINELVEKAKILIEVDGNYWHDFEQDNVKPQFVKQGIKDFYKNSLAIFKNYNLLRIWESEMSRNVLKEKILDLLFQLYPQIEWNEYII